MAVLHHALAAPAVGVVAAAVAEVAVAAVAKS